VDGVRIAKDEQGSRPCPGDFTGTALGNLAFAGDQLLGHRDAARPVLVSVFSGVYGGHDSNAGGHRLDLHQHKERVAGTAAACKFDGLACSVQSRASSRRAGNWATKSKIRTSR